MNQKNSKKYFTKYLPVEGEIQEGDNYQMAWMGGKVEIMKDVDYGHFNPNELGAKKVKLFLCSRDIQVGDKIICDGKEDVVEIYPFDDPQPLPDGGYTIVLKEAGTQMLENCFKVIGEVSPEATWVKEGDEFDEGQIKPLWFKKLNDKGGFEWRNQTLQPDNPVCYGVKGPCGHFH